MQGYHRAPELATAAIDAEGWFNTGDLARMQDGALFIVGRSKARHEGCFGRYVEVVFRNMWSEPKKMDESEVIRSVLEENGLDAGRLLERAQSSEVKQELVRNTEASVARGTFGSPNFFVGEEIFSGKDQLRDVEEMCLRRRT